MKNHASKRQEVYQTITGFWHDLYGTEYALLDVKVQSKDYIDSIRTVTERVGRIFNKTSSLLRNLDDETLLQLGFPHQTLSYIRFKSIPFESTIARLDLVVKDNEIKVLEINSDTPTFIKETYRVNEHICQYFGCGNPNQGMEKQLAESIIEAITWSFESLDLAVSGKVVFTAHIDHEEDYLTAQYLMELSGIEAEFIPLHELKIIEEDTKLDNDEVIPRGLYTPSFERIDVLYRQTYPIEHLIDDEDPVTNDKVGEILLQLVEEKRVAFINPPSAFLLQSKAIMALIWGLHEQNHSFYKAEEHEWINTYFLPTYLDPSVFQEQSQAYVKKPSFGREGDTVEIYNDHGEKQLEDQHKTYASALSVYQQYIELPEQVITTETGKKTVKIMYGCFLINGKAGAIGIRAGGQITDNASYFLPIGTSKREEEFL